MFQDVQSKEFFKIIILEYAFCYCIKNVTFVRGSIMYIEMQEYYMQL
jgi:hypothetical protein